MHTLVVIGLGLATFIVWGILVLTDPGYPGDREE